MNDKILNVKIQSRLQKIPKQKTPIFDGKIRWKSFQSTTKTQINIKHYRVERFIVQRLPIFRYSTCF